MTAEQFLLRYHKQFVYLPDPEPSRSAVTDEMRRLAAHEPPFPVPLHCKPWLDGQTVGWTLFYGYLTPLGVRTLPDGTLQPDNLAQLKAEAQTAQLVETIADGYFTLATGYKLRTEPGCVCLILPPTRPTPGYEVLTAVLETDWFAKEVFLTMRTPPPGSSYELAYRAELARVVVIPRLETAALRPFTAEEIAESAAAEAAYRAEEQTTPTRWRAANGHEFTHLYKQYARAHRLPRRTGDPDAAG